MCVATLLCDYANIIVLTIVSINGHKETINNLLKIGNLKKNRDFKAPK